MDQLLTETAAIAEVASALGITPGRLKRTYRKLHEQNGFPPPLPGGNWVWGRRAVLRWIAGPALVIPGANDNAAKSEASTSLGGIVAAQAEHLAARYGQGARR